MKSLIPVLCVIALACGDDDGPAPATDAAASADGAAADADGGPAGDPDAAATDAAAADPDAGATPDAAAAGTCATAIAALVEELYEDPQTCTAVVRLDHDSLAVLGYQLVCGPYNTPSEVMARTTAEADTGYGGAPAAVLSPPEPVDGYVFYESPGDFGGASAVSSHSGLSVFGGSIVWDGAGELNYPKTWRPAAELAAGCDPSGGISKRRGYDLVSGEELTLEAADAALDVVRATALPAAMWEGGYVFEAIVLRYPRTVGAFDPTSAEWIVLLNGGYLE